MRKLNVSRLVLIAGLVGCGGGGGGGSAAAPEIQTQASAPTSYAIANEAALPACDASRDGNLVYIKDTKVFKTCDAGAWADVDVKGEKGDAGESGEFPPVSIVTNKKIYNPGFDDFCTGWAGEICYINGGQFIKYSDGTVIIVAHYGYGMYDSTHSDSDDSYATLIVPPSMDTHFIDVGRASYNEQDYKSLLLVYTRNSDKITVVYDQNANFTPDASEPTIATLTAVDY